MAKRTGFLWLGGGIQSEGAGTADFHMTRSGQCDLVAGSDEEAIALARKVFAFIPQNCWEKPAPAESGDDPERREEQLLHVMPDNPKFTYDMHENNFGMLKNCNLPILDQSYPALLEDLESRGLLDSTHRHCHG